MTLRPFEKLAELSRMADKLKLLSENPELS
jgi:hypothetical protein